MEIPKVEEKWADMVEKRTHGFPHAQKTTKVPRKDEKRKITP